VRVVESFPRAVREIENCWIPMPDGCRLAARIWLPGDAEASPVPAIIEYIPYRKRDGTRWRDEPMHHYFAGHGYAAVRVDLRGSGESDGLLCDEYLDQEIDDGVEVIRWVAAQPWCTGAAGMMGKSWGGFNSLQVAARRPPQLKAVIAVCCADDRYADDAHFMGGCLLNENLIWGSVLFTINAQPPDPALVGDRWREMWLERLHNTPLFPEIWMRRQRRDEYWKRGSVGEDFGLIECPVYAVSGWADGYTNAVPRLLAGLRSPRKGLVGPWAHVYPHEGVPGPAIGFLQEALRWWNCWLKGEATGIMDEPMYRVWMQENTPPKSFHACRPGRWVCEDAWPSGRIEMRRWAMQERRLHQNASLRPDQGSPRTFRSPQTAGLAAGSWCGFGFEGEMPADQREDDGRSLTFDSDPLPERLEILGAPMVTLSLAADRPQALVAVRVNDVSPDGSSARVSYGLLNLTHRESDKHPTPLELLKRYTVRVKLNDAAHAFPAGNRIRVAVSTSYWPLAWPSPGPVTIHLYGAESFLELPLRTPRPEDETLRPFEKPEGAPPLESTDLAPTGVQRTITRDLTTNETVYTTAIDVDDAGDPVMTIVPEIDLETGHGIVECFRIAPDSPLSASARVSQTIVRRRGNWRTRIETELRLSSTETEFRLQADLAAYEGDDCVFSRSWDRLVARDGV